MARILSPADRLSILVLLGFLGATFARDPRAWETGVLVVALGALLAAIAWWGARSPIGRTAHAFLSPYVSVALLFELSSRVVAAVAMPNWDARLAEIDARHFGWLATAWRGALGRPAWLTDFAGVAYVSFYFFPLAVGLAIFLHRTRREFEDFAFTTMAAFFLPYVGYILMPASGPRDAVTLAGARVAEAAHAFVGTVELNGFDAFPSGHTAVAITVAALGARAFPKWTAPLALVAASIVFSTVYLAYHYVVDVVAGAMLAAALPALVPVLRRACGLQPARKRFVEGARPADATR